MTARTDPSTDGGVVRLARTVSYGLVAAILATVATGSEVWPLSQLELFSGVRTGESVSWQLVTVDDAGAEGVVDLSGLPANLGLVHHVLPRLAEADPSRRQQTVRLWLDAVAADRDRVLSARVYEVRRTVTTTATAASTELSRSLAYEVPLR